LLVFEFAILCVEFFDACAQRLAVSLIPHWIPRFKLKKQPIAAQMRT
jgi:hypothetical protein